jgi:uncharacterized protein YecE (DUF72 family)
MADNTFNQHAPLPVRVGTSGYSFEDWRGPFYPSDIDKGKMLDFYVQQFPTVEINSTYYRIPHRRVFEHMAAKAPKGFDLMVKVPQALTHKRSDISKDAGDFREAVKPLAESGKLSGVLAQFPFSFKFTPLGLDYLCACRDEVAPHLLFVEFRHNSWVNRAMYDRLTAEGIGYVSVDEPQLPGLLNPDCFATTDTVYVRLHGRNTEHWWKGGPLRYDYSYSEQELSPWAAKINKNIEKGKKAYVFFNNCHMGQAAGNARDFADLLSKG